MKLWLKAKLRKPHRPEPVERLGEFASLFLILREAFGKFQNWQKAKKNEKAAFDQISTKEHATKRIATYVRYVSVKVFFDLRQTMPLCQ
jgi:hypothetical protein